MKIKVLHVASEGEPFAKTGGLADVVGSLPQALAKIGCEVRLALPKYKRVTTRKFGLQKISSVLEVPLGKLKERGKVYLGQRGRIRVYFIEKDEYFFRDELYGTEEGDYPDNAQRFAFFGKAVLETLKMIDWRPDIIHAHDWHTGLVPLYLKTFYQADDFFQKIATVITIHNLLYQGIFGKGMLSLIGLSKDQSKKGGLEFGDKLNFLKAGIINADVITTVSSRYSQEIQTREFGCGLEDVLKARGKDLYGILNGLDYEVWDPTKDTFLYRNYGVEDLEGKAENKRRLQKECKLPLKPDTPLVGFIGRLVSQKGLDILEEAFPEMMKLKLQFILLGKGDRYYHELCRRLGKEYREKMSVNITYDPRLARRIYAGSDIFLMPSKFEPCGLGQLISMRYGTIPVVHATGGLADTISEEEGNGFAFSPYASSSLLEVMRRALRAYEDRENWQKLIAKVMNLSFSWEDSAQRYLQVYRQILASKTSS